jgi:hypothetical protein
MGSGEGVGRVNLRLAGSVRQCVELVWYQRPSRGVSSEEGVLFAFYVIG